MTTSFYAISVPVCSRVLNNLDGILEKAAQHAADNEIDESAFIQARLFPDMFAFARQIQIACDLSLRGMMRLAGQEPPSVPDNEGTFDELRKRVAETVKVINGLDEANFADAANRDVTFPTGDTQMTLSATDYLLHFVFPNVFFHAATAYNILRHNGVALGKADFLGGR